MTSNTLIVPAVKGYTTLSGNLPAGTFLQNLDQNSALWVSDSPNVAVNAGIRLSPFGSLTWQNDAPCYAIVDSGVTTPISVMLSDAVANTQDPVALAAAVAVKLLNQNVQVTNPVALAAGTNVAVSNSITVGNITGGTVNLAQGTAVGIAGTPTVNATGTVGLASGTAVGITGTPSVAVSSGTVGLAAGTSVGLAAGTAVGLASGTAVGITGTPSVAVSSGTVGLAAGTSVGLAAGTAVGLASGTAVAITGTPTVGLSTGTAVGITGTPTVGLSAGTAVGLASGASVAIGSGTLTGITNAIPVQSHPVTLSGQSVGITGTPPVQPVSSNGTLVNQTAFSIAASNAISTLLALTNVAQYSNLVVSAGTKTGSSAGTSAVTMYFDWCTSAGTVLLTEQRVCYVAGLVHLSLLAKADYLKIRISQSTAAAITWPVVVQASTDTFDEYYIQETGTTNVIGGATDQGSDFVDINNRFVSVHVSLLASTTTTIQAPSRAGFCTFSFSGAVNWIRLYHDTTVTGVSTDGSTTALVYPTANWQSINLFLPPMPTAWQINTGTTGGVIARCSITWEK